MYYTEYQDMEFSVRDCVYGVVTSSSRNGIFIMLENGQDAFAFFGGLARGTEVLCTVLKNGTDGRGPLVSVDSVLTEPIVAA